MKMFKLTKLGLTILAAATLSACHDDLDMSGIRGQLDQTPFDYSTVTNPTVNISYQDLGFGQGVTTSVYFELYDENPLEESDHGSVKKANVMPFFAGYTKQDGTWTGTVELPAYATTVYAFSPGSLAQDLMVSEVNGETISFSDTDYRQSSSSTRAIADYTINESGVQLIGSYFIKNSQSTYYLLDTEYGFLSISNAEEDATSFAIFKSTSTSNAVNYYLYSIKSSKFLISAFTLSTGTNNAKFEYSGLTNATLSIAGKTFNITDDGSLSSVNNGTKWTLTSATGDNAITDAQTSDAINKIKAISYTNGPVGNGKYYTNTASKYNKGGVATTPGGNGWKTWLGQYSNTAKTANTSSVVSDQSVDFNTLSGGIAYANQFYPYDYINSAGEETNDRVLNIEASRATTLLAKYNEVINSSITCPAIYRSDNQGNDLEMSTDAAVAITLLGGDTGWSNSIGYYYYSGTNTPQNINECKIILIAPNTQDGWHCTNCRNGQGIVRGTTVQLYYFGEGDNFKEENKTNIFPKGTKIGFVLKGHAWNDRNEWSVCGVNNYSAGGNIDNATAHYSATTPTIKRTYYPKGGSSFQSTGCASFQPEGFDEIMLGFEDHVNDANFSDVVFTLTSNPAGSVTGANIASKSSTVTTIKKGVYAYEDLWPKKGDYDMNDVVVEASAEKYIEVVDINSGGTTSRFSQMKTETFHFKPYENYAAYYNGLAVTLEPGNSDITEAQIKTAIASAVIKINGETTDAPLLHYRSNTIFITDIINQYAYTTNALAIANTTADKYTRPAEAADITITLTYPSVSTVGLKKMPNENQYIKSTAFTKIKPFIYRLKSSTGTNPKTWEVHIPFEAPTDYMDLSYFGQEDDYSGKLNSDGTMNWTMVNRRMADGSFVNTEGYYLREGQYPFAFYAAGTVIGDFNSLLDPNNETVAIDKVYPKFKTWVDSKGASATNWWK